MEKNVSIHICDRSHINITMNVYNCGNKNIEVEQSSRPDYYVFYYVKEGRGHVTQCLATHKVRAGQCFMVFPNEAAVLKADHKMGMNVSWVAFSGYLVDRYLMRAKITAYEPLFDDTPERDMERMFDELLRAAQRSTNRYCMIMAQMYSLFAFMLDHVPQEARTETVPPEMYLIKALDFIDIYYQDDISVEDIAASVGLNRKNLYTIFKKLTGFSTRDYLIFYRMCKATDLLKTTNLPVETVAVSVGYSDQFHFSKEFKKNVGFSPSEYRRVIAQNPEKEYRAPIDVVRQQYPASVTETPPKF